MMVAMSATLKRPHAHAATLGFMRVVAEGEHRVVVGQQSIRLLGLQGACTQQHTCLRSRFFFIFDNNRVNDYTQLPDEA